MGTAFPKLLLPQFVKKEIIFKIVYITNMVLLHIESDDSLEGQYHLSLLQISSFFFWRNVWNFLCSFDVNSTLFFRGVGKQVHPIFHITKLK
jgi:hypothetical protein